VVEFFIPGYLLTTHYSGAAVHPKDMLFLSSCPQLLIISLTIFRKPILNKNKNPQAIKDDIKRVVLHEIGHYFGLSEHELYVIEREHLKRAR